MGLAEAVRFELTEGLHLRQFSRLLHSTTLPRFRSAHSTTKLIVLQFFAGEKHIGKTEARQVFNTHGIENAIEVITFVLYHACMEIIDGAVYGVAELVEPGVPQVRITR